LPGTNSTEEAAYKFVPKRPADKSSASFEILNIEISP